MSKKPTPKPLLAIKDDFYTSLNHTIHQAFNLIQAVEFAIVHGDLSAPLADTLTVRADALRAALMDETGDLES